MILLKSKLVIGCIGCLQKAKKKVGYTINSNGYLRTPIPTTFAYTETDIHELFFDNFTCPYCSRSLTFTPEMMAFVTDFLKKQYHIDFQTKQIIIINNKEQTFNIPKNKSLIHDDLNGLQLEPQEISCLLNVANDIDSKKWTFWIDSASLNSRYYRKSKPNTKERDI